MSVILILLALSIGFGVLMFMLSAIITLGQLILNPSKVIKEHHRRN
jgi:multisubunit Na+/H+ antiporter MnhC subunit